MRKLDVVKVVLADRTEKQITIDFERGAIVEGFLADGTYDVHPQNGHDCAITIKNGSIVKVA
jgi:hypothetical protein